MQSSNIITRLTLWQNIGDHLDSHNETTISEVSSNNCHPSNKVKSMFSSLCLPKFNEWKILLTTNSQASISRGIVYKHPKDPYAGRCACVDQSIRLVYISIKTAICRNLPHNMLCAIIRSILILVLNVVFYIEAEVGVDAKTWPWW